MGGTITIAGIREGATRDEPTGQIIPGVLFALESYRANVFYGGQSYLPPEQAGKITKFLFTRRSRAMWIANWVVFNIFL